MADIVLVDTEFIAFTNSIKITGFKVKSNTNLKDDGADIFINEYSFENPNAKILGEFYRFITDNNSGIVFDASNTLQILINEIKEKFPDYKLPVIWNYDMYIQIHGDYKDRAMDYDDNPFFNLHQKFIMLNRKFIHKDLNKFSWNRKLWKLYNPEVIGTREIYSKNGEGQFGTIDPDDWDAGFKFLDPNLIVREVLIDAELKNPWEEDYNKRDSEIFAINGWKPKKIYGFEQAIQEDLRLVANYMYYTNQRCGFCPTNYYFDTSKFYNEYFKGIETYIENIVKILNSLYIKCGSPDNELKNDPNVILNKKRDSIFKNIILDSLEKCESVRKIQEKFPMITIRESEIPKYTKECQTFKEALKNALEIKKFKQGWLSELSQMIKNIPGENFQSIKGAIMELQDIVSENDGDESFCAIILKNEKFEYITQSGSVFSYNFETKECQISIYSRSQNINNWSVYHKLIKIGFVPTIIINNQFDIDYSPRYMENEWKAPLIGDCVNYGEEYRFDDYYLTPHVFHRSPFIYKWVDKATEDKSLSNVPDIIKDQVLDKIVKGWVYHIKNNKFYNKPTPKIEEVPQFVRELVKDALEE